MSPRPLAFSLLTALVLHSTAWIVGEEVKTSEASELKKPAPPAPVEARASTLGDTIGQGIRTVTSKAGPAICRVEAEDDQGHMEGTGFLIDDEGTVVTSCLIGTTSEELSVLLGDEKYPAQRLVCDKKSGIALLKIQADEALPFLKLGQATTLEIGTPVIALGYPLELPLSP